MSKLIQPIVVVTSTHFETISAAAHAAAHMIRKQVITDPEALAGWLASGHAKVIRKTSSSKSIRRVTRLAEATGATVIRRGGAQAFAFPLVTREDMHPHLAKLQVSGIQAPTETTPVTGQIILDASASMSTGKAAAQAAHVAVAWALAHPHAPVPEFSIAEHSHDEFMACFPTAEFKVIDNGLTEIKPGTPTAYLRETH